MSPSTHTLRPVHRSDHPALGDLLYTSKLGLAINRVLFEGWPNEAIQRSNYLSALEALDREEFSESLTVLDNQTKEVIGHLALTRRRPLPDPETEGKHPTTPSTPPIPDFFNPEVFAAVVTAVDELSQDLKTIDHYEVTYIVVNPAYRNRGIGEELMQYVMGKAKTAGVPVAVGAEPQVYSFFIKHGFEERGHVDFDLAKWAPPYSGFGVFRLTGMIWYP
ncbi:hypothetical protein FE257_004110 [Aspergillus nanangensis]|uniref:N-acetyltransferase domain-containing protein n=1 Tax=Aspergillus nanangensis TaxID=2582783 RepID=A0AAD4GN79_ASPNN|nr:hypothetical protein FE257_004110 [Aspergillus nanangensis]